MDPMLIAAYLVAFLFEVGMPIALAVFVRRRLGVSWRYFWYGALIFFLSQIVTRIPLVRVLQFVLADQFRQSQALQWAWLVALALTAGLFEEIGRYLGYRYLVFRRSRSEVSRQLSAVGDQDPALDAWKKGVMYGLGHGGLESMLLVGGLVLLGLINGLVLSRMDPATIAALPSDQAEQVRQAQELFRTLPWWTPLLGAVERLFTIAVQVGFSILVLQAFLRDNVKWLYLAIGAHFLVDLVAVASNRFIGPVWTEAVIGVFALGALYLTFRLKPRPIA